MVKIFKSMLFAGSIALTKTTGKHIRAIIPARGMVFSFLLVIVPNKAKPRQANRETIIYKRKETGENKVVIPKSINMSPNPINLFITFVKERLFMEK